MTDPSAINVAVATAVMGDVPLDVQRRVFASMGITDWQERFVQDALRSETGPCLRLLSRRASRSRGPGE